MLLPAILVSKFSGTFSAESDFRAGIPTLLAALLIARVYVCVYDNYRSVYLFYIYVCVYI